MFSCATNPRSGNIKNFNSNLNHNLTDKTLSDIVLALKSAERPVILAGQGLRLSKSIDALHKFVGQA